MYFKFKLVLQKLLNFARKFCSWSKISHSANKAFYWNQRKENGDLWEENDKIKKAYASLKAVRIFRLFFQFFFLPIRQFFN